MDIGKVRERGKETGKVIFALLLFVLVSCFAFIFSFSSAFALGIHSFAEFRKIYGKDWLSLWETQKNPKLIFGGKFFSQNAIPLQPPKNYKTANLKSSYKFSPFSITAENDKLIITEIPSEIMFSPNGDGFLDYAVFSFQVRVSHTDSCGSQGNTPSYCYISWSLEIKKCGRDKGVEDRKAEDEIRNSETDECSKVREFESEYKIPEFLPGEITKSIPIKVVWDGKDDEGQLSGEGVYKWDFSVEYKRRSELCYGACKSVCEENERICGCYERCDPECTNKEKKLGAASVKWELILDLTPPEMVFLGPEPFSDDRSKVVIAYSDEFAGVITESLSVFMNGRDITEEFQKGETLAIFEPSEPLPEGEISLRFSVFDRAGNFTVGEGRFKVFSSDTLRKFGVARDFLISLKDVYGFREDLGDLSFDWWGSKHQVLSFSEGETSITLDITFAKFLQSYEGIPVAGANLSVIVDRYGDARGIYGRYFPDISAPREPVISPEEVTEIALREYMKGRRGKGPCPTCDIAPLPPGIVLFHLMLYSSGNPQILGKPTLWIYPVMKGDEWEYHLCWFVRVGYIGYFIDAVDGSVVKKVRFIANFGEQIIYASSATGYVYEDDWFSDSKETSIVGLPRLIAGIGGKYTCGCGRTLDLSCCAFLFPLCPLCWKRACSTCTYFIPLNLERSLLGDMGGNQTLEVLTYLGSATHVAKGNINWFYSYQGTSSDETFFISGLDSDLEREEAGFREVNAYYHVMRARDRLSLFGVSLTAPLTVYATYYPYDITTCNGFSTHGDNKYDIGLLNGGEMVVEFLLPFTIPCIPASWSDDVIYHEFGHVVLFNYKIFGSDTGREPVDGFHEGVADYISSLVDSPFSPADGLDSIIAEGFYCNNTTCETPNYIRNLEENMKQVGHFVRVECTPGKYYVCYIREISEGVQINPHRYGLAIGNALFRSINHFMRKGEAMGVGRFWSYSLFNSVLFSALYNMVGQNGTFELMNYGEFIANMIAVMFSQDWGGFEELKVIFHDVLATISASNFIAVDIDSLSEGVISTIIVGKPYVTVGRWLSRGQLPLLEADDGIVFSSPLTLVGFLGGLTDGDIMWRVRLATSPDLFSTPSGRTSTNYYETDWTTPTFRSEVRFFYGSSPEVVTYYFFEYEIPREVFDNLRSGTPRNQNAKIYVLIEVSNGGQVKNSTLRLGGRGINYYFYAPGTAEVGGGGGGRGGCSSFLAISEILMVLLLVCFYRCMRRLSHVLEKLLHYKMRKKLT
jgi:hypothetical protein